MKIIGHRGARGLVPENTIAGMQKGVEHHVDELEFDLRVTKDNVVILHHNRKLNDPNGQKHLIKHCLYVDLKDHKPDLTTLVELLEYIDKTLFYLEVKPGENTQPIIDILQKHPVEYLALASKSQKILKELHTALPDISKVVIHPWSGMIATRRAKQVGTKRISMNKLFLWFGFIKVMSGRKWKLSAYALNDPAKANLWAKHGLYGVVTDYPDRFEK